MLQCIAERVSVIRALDPVQRALDVSHTLSYTHSLIHTQVMRNGSLVGLMNTAASVCIMCVAVCCSALQCVAARCSVLQHVIGLMNTAASVCSMCFAV